MPYERGQNQRNTFYTALSGVGTSIQHLTMFANYWVPLLLHHLRILRYVLVFGLVTALCKGTGSQGELGMSIVAIERSLGWAAGGMGKRGTLRLFNSEHKDCHDGPEGCE